jgi:uncharacterized membrane protein YecN with MAPEG domain
MFFLPVALITAGAAALLNFWLGLRVSRLRISEKIMVGDGGNPRLVARMRAQLNFAEYTPLVLIMIALIELARGTQTWLWGVALVYIVGRILHAFGMDGWGPGRMIGIATTMLTMLGLAAYAVFLGYSGLNPLR